MNRQRVIIMGAAGRDFHNFNVLYRDNPNYEVVVFTAAQIPFIEGRIYPPEFSGDLYSEGIPIYPEDDLVEIIRKYGVNQVVFAYSDTSHEYVMHRASTALSLGADFVLHGPERTMIRSTLPVISVCAVRTGCGKSIITRRLAGLLKERGISVSVIRHPMPYRRFVPVMRFSTMKEVEKLATVEEREEIEPLVERGITVFTGVDCRRVVESVERESSLIIWDGGNNDFPFIKPDLEIVLIDALRPSHETGYYPGEVNLKRADILIITKVNEAKEEDLGKIRETIKRENPEALVLEASTVLTLSEPEMARGKRALVIEDGPTITHGGMSSGAGLAAIKGLVSDIIDPRPYAIGTIKDTYDGFPHIGPVLPAMGYSEKQIRDLEETVSRIPADVIIIATPVDLRRIIKIDKPVVRVFYDFDIDLNGVVDSFLKRDVR